MKVTNKDLFLKSLDKLFDSVKSKFNAHNTSITYDSCVINEPETVVLLVSWSKFDDSHKFLFNKLFLWIRVVTSGMFR